MTTKFTEKRIDIYSVIVLNRPFPDRQETERYDSLIDEILEISTPPRSIEKISEQFLLQALHSEKKSFHKLSDTKLTVLKFTSTSSVNSSSQKKTLKDSLVQFLLEEQIINSLYCFMTDLITCANILAPGILSIKEYYVFVDNQLYRAVEHFDIFNSIYAFKIPQVENISLFEAHNWIEKVEKDNGCSKTKLGRAIGALNRLIFSNISTLESMMWTMTAIEAFYNNPNEQCIKKQIIQKSKLITQSSINENDLSNMYKARSNFFHGSTDFKIYSSMYYQLESEIEKVSFDNNHLNTGLALLFKTLEYMVKHNKHDLEFVEKTYQLK